VNSGPLKLCQVDDHRGRRFLHWPLSHEQRAVGRSPCCPDPVCVLTKAARRPRLVKCGVELLIRRQARASKPFSLSLCRSSCSSSRCSGAQWGLGDGFEVSLVYCCFCCFSMTAMPLSRASQRGYVHFAIFCDIFPSGFCCHRSVSFFVHRVPFLKQLRLSQQVLLFDCFSSSSAVFVLNCQALALRKLNQQLESQVQVLLSTIASTELPAEERQVRFSSESFLLEFVADC